MDVDVTLWERMGMRALLLENPMRRSFHRSAQESARWTTPTFCRGRPTLPVPRAPCQPAAYPPNTTLHPSSLFRDPPIHRLCESDLEGRRGGGDIGRFLDARLFRLTNFFYIYG